MDTIKTAIAAIATAIVVLAALPGSGTTIAAEPQSAAAACGACHQGKRSFSGQDAEVLAAQIRSILDGELKHPPLRLDDSSEAAIEELAAELAAAR